jgi:membrane protein DedA with SNARE-associated domain
MPTLIAALLSLLVAAVAGSGVDFAGRRFQQKRLQRRLTASSTM